MQICILSIDDKGDVTNWIMATDFGEAFRKANALAIGHGEDSLQFRLAETLRELARSRRIPKTGKSTLPTGRVMLVS